MDNITIDPGDPKCPLCGDTGWRVYRVPKGFSQRLKKGFEGIHPSNRKPEHYETIQNYEEQVAPCNCDLNRKLAYARAIYELPDKVWRAYRFDTFLPKTSNQDKASNLLKSWIPKAAIQNFCYLWGNQGSGKTHLAMAWLSRIMIEAGGTKCFFTTGFQLGEIIQQYARVKMLPATQWGDDEHRVYMEMQDLQGANYLIIDDIQTLHIPDKENNYTGQAFLDFINYRYNHDCLTVITANYDLATSKSKPDEPSLARHLGEFGYTVASRIKGNGKRVFGFSAEDGRKHAKEESIDDDLPF